MRDPLDYIQINKEHRLYSSALKLMNKYKSTYNEISDSNYIIIDNSAYYYNNDNDILQIDQNLYDVLNRNFILQLKARRTG